MIHVRAFCIAVIASVALAPGLAAQQPSPPPPEASADAASKTLAMVQPGSVEECLDFVEKVLAHALDADLLDDQIEESELELEKMDAACHDKRFSDALASAKAIATIVSTNK